MQSSFWKLLTAAGIIGIGTLVVLEVQNRLPNRHTSAVVIPPESTGNEFSVTPDGSTDLDQALTAAAHKSAMSEPALFDQPGVGSGQPAPPADDVQHPVAMADHTVGKDQLFDEGSPFEASFEEPAEPSIAATAVDTSSGQQASRKVQTGITPVTPASFSPQSDPLPLAPVPAAETTAPSSPADEPLIPFESATSTPVAAVSETVKTQQNAAVTAPQPAPAAQTRVAEKNSILFFPNEAKSSPNPAPADNAVTDSGSSQRTKKTTDISGSPATDPKPSVGASSPKTVLQTSAVKDESQMFEPETESNKTPREMGDSPDAVEVPEFSLTPFEDESVPARTPEQTTPAPNTGPNTAAPDSRVIPVQPDEPKGDFFSDDSTGTTSPENLQPNPADDLQTLPYSSDEPMFDPNTDEPALGKPVPGRTTPRGSEPDTIPSDDFPEPRFPNEPQGRTEDDSDLDTPKPFEVDETDSGDSMPLPSADDVPADSGRPSTNPPSGQTGSDDRTRTVSEVMRPQLTIEKKAPDTATVGVSHEYTILVTNEGTSPAYDVIVEDELGNAADLVNSKPTAEFNRSANRLVWKFAELKAKEKKEITVRIKPTGEGTLDGVATVRFKAQVKSATVITAPKLELQLTGPGEVKVGDEVQLTFTIRNRGSGDAANVVLRSVLPPGLKHREGGDLEYEIENLRSNEKEDVELTVVAAEPGDLLLVSAEVTSSGVSAAKARMEIEVVGAQLTLERLGPERRYVGRSATYQNIVTNESRFEATNATVVEEVPEGMRFVSASNGGIYNPDNRRIEWTIPRLAASKQTILEVELVGEHKGQMETTVEVTENAGFRTPLKENTIVIVEDIHNVTAAISRRNEPVAIGERFGFTVTIDNRGTAVAKNVEMQIQVPAHLKVLAAGTRQVPGKLLQQENIVKYATVPEIQPNGQMTFQLTLQGEMPVKSAPVKAILKCDEMQEALIVSEAVTVFDDRP